MLRNVNIVARPDQDWTLEEDAMLHAIGVGFKEGGANLPCHAIGKGAHCNKLNEMVVGACTTRIRSYNKLNEMMVLGRVPVVPLVPDPDFSCR